AIAVLSYRSLTARTEASDAVAHTNEVQDHLHRLLSMAKDAETGQRGYLLTGDEHYLEPYQLALSELPGQLESVRRLVADNPAQAGRLDSLQAVLGGKLSELKETIDIRRAGDAAAALTIVRTDRGKSLMDRIRTTIEEMLSAEQNLLFRRNQEWEQSVTWSSYVMLGGVLVLIGMLILIGVLASRDYRAVSDEGWSRRVQLALSSQLQGDLRIESIGDKVLDVLSRNMGARVGAVYAAEPNGILQRIASHAMAMGGEPRAALSPGEGLTGQAVKQDKPTHLRALPAGYMQISSTVGKGAPRELVIAPAQIDGTVQAVTELGFLHALDPVELTLIERASDSIAQAMRAARDRNRLEQLLEEVQRQAEELQTQQEELRVSNEELEQQTRSLQVSQAQLENQQSELEQINAQLEEQTQALERQRDELAQTSSELLKSNEVKSQFLANMSHELRTPLNSSLILAKLLSDNREGNLNAEQIKFAQTIYSAGNDLLTLINDILDLSKIDAGMLDVRPEAVPLRRIADELHRTFQPIATQKGLELQIVTQRAPEMIETDPNRALQILKNLISNALKFTEHGGVTVTISGASGDVLFEVRDTGIGIAEDQHELIFEPFRQADGASNRKFGGTGLGLSISRDLGKLLGGGLTLSSAPGRGSTFTLTLPGRMPQSVGRPASLVVPAGSRATLERPAVSPRTPERAIDRTPERAIESISAERGAERSTERGTSPNRPLAVVAPAPFADDRDSIVPTSRTLLVIEDDITFSRVLYDLAHELEFSGVVAATAADGLALARQHLPHAIVLDVGLPDRSGLAVLDSLKRDP
ncbi:MAG TPA: CHASE3 domain-containing protein, partial [Kofleriaceae bacterium]